MNKRITKWSEEDLLALKLIEEEFNISEEFLFTPSKHFKPLHALSILTDIFVNQQGRDVNEIYKMYVEKGYSKTRPCLYNQLKVAKRLLRMDREILSSYQYIVDDLSGIRKEKSERLRERDIYIIKGRILDKVHGSNKIQDLNELETAVNLVLTKQKEKYAEKTEEAWLT